MNFATLVCPTCKGQGNFSHSSNTGVFCNVCGTVFDSFIATANEYDSTLVARSQNYLIRATNRSSIHSKKRKNEVFTTSEIDDDNNTNRVVLNDMLDIPRLSSSYLSKLLRREKYQFALLGLRSFQHLLCIQCDRLSDVIFTNSIDSFRVKKLIRSVTISFFYKFINSWESSNPEIDISANEDGHKGQSWNPQIDGLCLSNNISKSITSHGKLKHGISIPLSFVLLSLTCEAIGLPFSVVDLYYSNSLCIPRTLDNFKDKELVFAINKVKKLKTFYSAQSVIPVHLIKLYRKFRANFFKTVYVGTSSLVLTQSLYYYHLIMHLASNIINNNTIDELDIPRSLALNFPLYHIIKLLRLIPCKNYSGSRNHVSVMVFQLQILVIFLITYLVNSKSLNNYNSNINNIFFHYLRVLAFFSYNQINLRFSSIIYYLEKCINSKKNK